MMYEVTKYNRTLKMETSTFKTFKTEEEAWNYIFRKQREQRNRYGVITAYGVRKVEK
jgi:hypothetical protein